MVLVGHYRYAQRLHALYDLLGSCDTSWSGEGTEPASGGSIPGAIAVLHLQGARTVVGIVQALFAPGTSVVNV